MFNDPTNKDGIYTEICFVHLSRFVYFLLWFLNFMFGALKQPKLKC